MIKSSILIFLTIFSSRLLAEEIGAKLERKRPFTFHLNQPIGYLSKVRMKLEYHYSANHSVLLSFASFYGLAPGYQASLDYRRYFKTHINMDDLDMIRPDDINVDYYYQFKLGFGESYKIGGKYTGTIYLVGMALGKKVYFGANKRFALDILVGLKACVPLKGDPDSGEQGFHGLYYLTGPGTPIDMNFHFTYRI